MLNIHFLSVANIYLYTRTYKHLDSILKSRDISLPTKVRLVKAMVFPMVMYGCESGTIRKAECWRIDAFELWWWRRLLRVPWTARRSNQSILKEISPGCTLEGLTLKLKLQYFDHLIQRADSLEKTLMLRGIGGRRRRGNRGWHSWMASPTRWTWVWVNSRSWWWTGRSGVLWFMGQQRVGHDWATELTDWTFLERQLCTEPGFLSLLGSPGLTFPGAGASGQPTCCGCQLTAAPHHQAASCLLFYKNVSCNRVKR